MLIEMVPMDHLCLESYTIKNEVCIATIPNGVINDTNHTIRKMISTFTVPFIIPFGMVCTLHFLQCIVCLHGPFVW